MSKRKIDEEKENMEELPSEEPFREQNDSYSEDEIIEENFIDENVNESFSDAYQESSLDFTTNSSYNEVIDPPSEEDYQDVDVEKIISENNLCKKFFEKTFFIHAVKNLFIKFLNSHKNKKYIKCIKEMCSENLESLRVSYMDISDFNETLLKLLDCYPEQTLEIFESGLEQVVKVYFPNYDQIKKKLHCRIIDLPISENIRSLRNNHLNKLVRIKGVVTRRTGVFPQFFIIKYTCMKCQAVFGPFSASSSKPTHCYECQSRGPFTINSSETVYKDFQKLTLQEVPGTVPPGTLPRSKEVLLFYDLIDTAKPGEEIEVIGIYKNNFNVSLNIKNGFPVFFTVIEGVFIEKNVNQCKLNEEDIKEIKRLSKNPNVKNIIFNSIAPSICGHFNVKRAIAIALFGGVMKEKNNHRVRGDINVLLLGDPGTAKSQFLRYVEKTSNRAVLATGQGASSVGLTASVRRDPVIKEWTLEGGALVLADNGVCLIDEFDKMNDHDRTSIHEAMEQQSISISKAGIVATLHARCTVIAAANPTRGVYNSSLTFAQNVNLSDPILSRFDILCVVKDNIDSKEDEIMANHILNSHRGNVSDYAESLDHEFLKKYILYAKTHITPVFSNVNVDKISNLYSELRRESISSGLPITVRHIECIIRISEAFAKMELRNYVSFEDIDEAISVVLDSFMGAQKYSVTKNMRKKFLKYFKKSNADVIIFILKEMFNERIRAYNSNYILLEELDKQLKGYGISCPVDIFGSKEFLDNGFLYDKEKNLVTRSI
ncbi:DNA replication licensing factor MCM2 [Vairimorpha necatrix]|uniref:DNA replication licensing factor MCM2 n=1 Tax=Vairimorpha necatrix TaxID=6039 RepID=A0AAX4JBY0_9MICR